MFRLGALVKRARAEAAAAGAATATPQTAGGTQPPADTIADAATRAYAERPESPPAAIESAEEAVGDIVAALTLPPLLPLMLPPSMFSPGDDALPARSLSLALEAISEAAEASLLAFLRSSACARAWILLRSRRVATFGGDVTAAGLDASAGPPLPPPLAALARALVAAGAFPAAAPPNHALLNDYAPGEGILPHTDGPAYAPCTATLSLGGAAIMTLAPAAPPGAAPAAEVALPRRSLVVFSGAVYAARHGIPARATDVLGALAPCVNAADAPAPAWPRAQRLSITLRHAPPMPSATT